MHPTLGNWRAQVCTQSRLPGGPGFFVITPSCWLLFLRALPLAAMSVSHSFCISLTQTTFYDSGVVSIVCVCVCLVTCVCVTRYPSQDRVIEHHQPSSLWKRKLGVKKVLAWLPPAGMPLSMVPAMSLSGIFRTGSNCFRPKLLVSWAENGTGYVNSCSDSQWVKVSTIILS